MITDKGYFRYKHILFLLFLLTPVPLYGGEGIIEKDINYSVGKEDFEEIIEGKLGLDWAYIATINGIKPNESLRTGQTLKIPFKRIIPMKIENGIVINIPDRTLYRFVDGKLKDYHFIAAGKPTWQTNLGEFTVVRKTKYPTWHVPISIQKEMKDNGQEIPKKVAPGPDNPLGKYWIQLSMYDIGLHGTNKPQSVYKFESHGCIRLRPEVVESLFNDVPIGTKVMVIYEPIKIFRTPEGRILLEVYRDFYEKLINYNDRITAKLKELNVIDKVDWNKIKEIIEKKDGLVRDVTLG